MVEAGYLRRNRAYYNVTVMSMLITSSLLACMGLPAYTIDTHQ